MSTLRVALSSAVVSALAVPLTLAAPLTGVAHATSTTTNLVYAADIDRDGLAGVYRATTDAPTTRTAVLTDNGNLNVFKVSLSPDGSRIAVLADFSAATTGGAGPRILETMNLDGSNRKVLVSEVWSSTSTGYTYSLIDGFSWEGNTKIVYGWYVDSSKTTAPTQALYDIPATGGTRSFVADFMSQPSVSADGTMIAAVEQGSSNPDTVDLWAFPINNVATKRRVVDSSPTPLYSIAWSPDKTSLAFVRDESDPNTHLDASQVEVARFDSGTGIWGAPTTAVPLVRGADSAIINDDVIWTDNSTLMFERVDDSSSAAPTGFYTPIDLWTSSFDSGTSSWGAPTKFTDTPTVDEWSPSEAPADITAPANVTVLPFGLGGTSVTVRWSPNDADFSHVVLYRTDTTAATAEVPLGNKFGTGFVDTGLTVGHTYSYRFQTVDGAGNTTNDDVAHLVTATNLPKIVAVTPTSLVNTSLPFRVTWGVAQSAPTTYDVVYAVKGGATWALGSSYAFATGTTATNGVFSKGVPGQTYYFRATAHDTHGNTGSTAWSGVNVPMDQTAGSFSHGWVTVKSSHYWLGSLAATSTNGSYYTVAVTSKSMSIIGTKCAACGKFAVYVDGHYRGTVSAAATTTQLRQVLWTGVNTTIGRHVIKLVAVLATHKTFQIDGIADPR